MCERVFVLLNFAHIFVKGRGISFAIVKYKKSQLFSSLDQGAVMTCLEREFGERREKDSLFFHQNLVYWAM